MEPAHRSVGGADRLKVHDVFVFLGLELLGTLAVTGNFCLIIVLLRNKYLNRASFILMLSLACADVLHGICTTSYFYPPIILRDTVPEFAVRVFNIIDWTAWSITLTHMSAICLDRLIAIMLFGKYNEIITVKRIRRFSIGCWITCLTVNITYFAFDFCCLIRPLRNSHYYTFGYDENKINGNSFMGSANIYMYTYTPTEIATLVILSISNPITLVQLYRRHKRKIALRQQAPPHTVRGATPIKTRSQWQRASSMLLEMSIRMGSKLAGNDVREVASRRANRQQQRILLQISVIAVIFYSYMATYYLVYYIFETQNKWVMLFNSFFYSTTHMINPVIYFSLNKEMRAQLMTALSDLLSLICCAPSKSRHQYGSMIKLSVERKTSNKIENSFTETSPLFSSVVTNNRTSNFAPSATISKLQKESLSSAVLIDAANTLPHAACAINEQPLLTESAVIQEDVNDNTTTTNNSIEIDPEDIARAQEQRRSLLDALIQALTNFTNQFSEDEGDEVVAAVIQTHMKRFGSSKSTEFTHLLPSSNVVKHSKTLHSFEQLSENQNAKHNISPKSIKSPETAQNVSEANSSGSEQINRLINSNTWQQWSEIKRRESYRSHATDRDSLTMLLAESSLPDSDEDDVIYL